MVPGPPIYINEKTWNAVSAEVHTHNATISSTGGLEIRLVNTTVVYAIKF
ncbi:hypothetical protein [Bartonella bovis]|nr:hypothetical protein [Bartonella bovis]